MLKTLGLLAFAAEFAKGGWSQVQGPEQYAQRAVQAGVPATPAFIRCRGWAMVLAAIGL
ncbi:MAG TPA: hypothetical protein VIR57_14010 [Chloroflexota bacterium]